jgi:cell division septal protein FtsQ
MSRRIKALDGTNEPGRFLRRRGNLRVRRERRVRVLVRISLRYGILLAVVAAALWGGKWARDWTVTTPALAVEHIQVEGARHAEAATLRSLVADARSRNLFSLDMDALVSNVKKHPWVRSVVIRRRLPDTLVIRVEERRPCALLVLEGEAFLLDRHGARIERFGPRTPAWSFPVLRGLDGLEPAECFRRCRVAARQVQMLGSRWSDFLTRLEEVDLSDPAFSVLSFEGGSERLRVSPEDWTRNLDTYRALRSHLAQRHGKIRHVDLRWEGRVVATPEEAG